MRQNCCLPITRGTGGRVAEPKTLVHRKCTVVARAFILL